MLSKGTLWTLYDNSIEISEYIMQIKTLLTGLTQNVLLYIYFEDENEDEEQQAERTNMINETLLKLFFLQPL